MQGGPWGHKELDNWVTEEQKDTYFKSAIVNMFKN